MKTIKTIAFASLVAFSTLAFTACGSKSGSEETADTTVIINESDLLQDADDAANNMMEAVDTAAANIEEAAENTEAAIEEATDGDGQ